MVHLRFLRHDIEPPPMTPPGKRSQWRSTGSKDGRATSKDEWRSSSKDEEAGTRSGSSTFPTTHVEATVEARNIMNYYCNVYVYYI